MLLETDLIKDLYTCDVGEIYVFSLLILSCCLNINIRLISSGVLADDIRCSLMMLGSRTP